jgi:hypothetical protein
MACMSRRDNYAAWLVVTAILVGTLVVGCEEHRPIRSRPVRAAPPPPPPNPDATIPAFPWPPPAASASEVLPRTMFEQRAALSTLGNLNEELVSALQTTGYFEKSYYSVPRGFALATRLERISEDGSSKTPPDRWSAEPPHMTHFSISEYLHSLFLANAGHYRVVVFIVTDVPFAETGTAVTLSDVQKWPTGGTNTLPAQIASSAFGQNTECTALIYEFESAAGNAPVFVQPGRLDAHTHLVKSGLWAALGGPQ